MTLDPTTFAVLRRSFMGIATEMGITLAKVAYSPVITEGLDFSGALYDRHGHLVACGRRDLTGLLGTLEPSIQFVFDRLGQDSIGPGDVILTNCPHEAGTHMNDVKAIKGVFWEGEIIGYVADVGHWTDVGGGTPGSINPLAQDSFGEGLRITPVKVVEEGEIRQDVLDLILGNVRIPYETNGDIFAQIKACDAGEARLHELVETYSPEMITEGFSEVQDYASDLFRHELEQIEDGEAEWSDFIDMDPLARDAGPVKIHLRLIKHGDEAIFDFTGTDPQPQAGIGAPYPLTCSGVYVPVLNLFPNLVFNHGFTRMCQVRTTPGSAVHVEFPNPVSGAAAGAFEKVTVSVLNTVGQLAPHKQVGATYNLINVTLGGKDPRFDGKPYVMYMWNEGGFGGGPDRDGGDAPTMAMFATGSRNQPVEVHERFYPVVYTELTISEDSGGPGQWRGCPGIRHSYRVQHGDAVIGVFGDRGAHKPWGVHGGWPGGGQFVYVNRATPEEQALGMFASDVPVREGDIVEVWSSGGGGYGNPLDRDPDLVLKDVQNGFVSLVAAEQAYGVVIRMTDTELQECELDLDATRTLRSRLRADPQHARGADWRPAEGESTRQNDATVTDQVVTEPAASS